MGLRLFRKGFFSDMEREQAIKIEVLKIAAFTIIAVAAIIAGASMYGSRARATIQSAEATIRAMEAKTRELQIRIAELNQENLRLQQEIVERQALLLDKLQRGPIPTQVKAGAEPDRSPRRSLTR